MSTAAVVIDHITKYEYTRIRGFRLEQLANGAIPYVQVDDHDDAAAECGDSGSSTETIQSIFDREARAGALPYKIKRSNNQTVTCYKACIDSLGRMRRIRLQWRTTNEGDEDEEEGELMVSPSTSVSSVLGSISDQLKRKMVRLEYLGKPLQHHSLLWDNDITEDASIFIA